MEQLMIQKICAKKYELFLEPIKLPFSIMHHVFMHKNGGPIGKKIPVGCEFLCHSHSIKS